MKVWIKSIGITSAYGLLLAGFIYGLAWLGTHFAFAQIAIGIAIMIFVMIVVAIRLSFFEDE